MSTFHAIVWIDSQQAHVIHFDREHIESQKIKARHSHASQGAAEAFYHAVATSLKGAHEILVTGPARAKDEFKAHCEHHDRDLAKAIVGVVGSDHPSDGQLTAMARQYFLKYDRMQGQA